MGLSLGSFGFQSSSVSGGGNAIIVLNQGSVITTGVTSLNFTGSYISASAIGNAVSISIDGSDFLQKNGSVSLTANWNVGAYEVTANKFIGNNGFGFNVGLGGSLVSASTTGSAKTWTLPNTAGTIALTTDINPTITAQDEGVTLTSALATINFVGAGVSATSVGNDVTVTIAGGSGTVTSVGLTMPDAFSVANSPITGSGNLEVTASGLSSQYIRGDGQLANFPTSFGGGSTVDLFFNGSINQGTLDGNVYYELGTDAITGGSSTNFTLSTGSPSVRFITDVNVPDELDVPNGVWTVQTYLNQNDDSGQCTIQADLYKYDGATFTLISSGASESITNGISTDLYTYNISIPLGVTLDRTDRLAIVLTAGNFGGTRTLTLHTEGNEVGQVHTTYSKGINTLNGLTDSVQYFSTGTSGTSFNISSVGDTHTFNLPTASSLNSGALSNTDWTTFNNKGTGDLKADGSVPLTANWNVGAYEITANKFIGNNGFGFNVGLGGSLVSESTSGSAKTWTLPNTAGTIALTTDIPSVSGFLKADGTVPLTANWNVGAYEITANKFIGNNGFGFNVGLGGSLVSASTSSSAKTWTLPNITGTIALIESPAFSGTPTAPTPTIGDNTTKIATTEFVTSAVGGGTQFGTIFSQTNFNFLT
jgi:hypothetical protein